MFTEALTEAVTDAVPEQVVNELKSVLYGGTLLVVLVSCMFGFVLLHTKYPMIIDSLLASLFFITVSYALGTVVRGEV